MWELKSAVWMQESPPFILAGRCSMTHSKRRMAVTDVEQMWKRQDHRDGGSNLQALRQSGRRQSPK